MKATGQLGRWGALVVLGLGAAEVIIMISPFAGFFYASLQFDPLLGFLSRSPLTAWLDGFFLNHSVVTSSWVLEAQRQIGLALFLAGLLGFVVSAVQVYGNKLAAGGVAMGGLYRLVRHPQYLCLSVAGWGLLTAWPRFLLLGFWVTMLFLYAGLARFEERRMQERFGDSYRSFAATRGAFLPASPVRRLFETTFGRLRPRPLAWALAYAFCLVLAFSLGFALRATTRANTAVLVQPAQKTVVVSVWPQPEEWMRQIYEAAATDARVVGRLSETQGEEPLVATILSPRYAMSGMYYKMAGDQGEEAGHGPLMGVDPDSVDEPVEVVFSRAEKPYRETLSWQEALDVDVRLTPLVIADVLPSTAEVTRVRIPLPQNVYGPNVVMPLL